jgi:FtsP/CotA-like multicopper oxidase with cupredoxin domain
MTVIANDFVPINPYETDVLTLGVGQRYDVLVKGTGKASDSVWMRSSISTVCSLPKQPYALAAVYYNQANDSSTPNSLATPFDDSNCSNVSPRPSGLGCFYAYDSRRT